MFKDYLIKDAIKYNLENNLSLLECVFRRESDMFQSYFKYIKENREELSKLVGGFDDCQSKIINSDIGEKGIFEGNEVWLDLPFMEILDENHDGVELNKPKRGGSKKFYVYVKNEKGNIIKVSFGDSSGLKVKFNDEAARKSFVARHDCENKHDKTTPGYWSCNLPKYAKLLGLSDGGNFYW